MKWLASLKQLRLVQVLTVFLVGLTLMFTVACSNGDIRGARPHNPPVQAGGANNPYAGSGDGYTTYNQSPDPKVSKQ